VTGYELGKGVGNCNDRLLKILGLHSGGTPERTGTGHIASLSGGFRSIGRHGHPIRLRVLNSLDFIGNQQSKPVELWVRKSSRLCRWITRAVEDFKTESMRDQAQRKDENISPPLPLYFLN